MKRDNRSKLLNEAAEWRLLSLLFDCPADGWSEEVKALGENVRDKDLKKAARSAQNEATGGLFHSVFGPGGPAPGREVSYRGWTEPGAMLSEISAFYNAFAFTPNTREVPDHIAVETGFIAYLKMKELYALECGETDNAKIASDASESFIREHLSKYAETISKLLDNSGIEYLHLSGKALFQRVGRDPERGKQIFLPVLEDLSDDAELTCGTI
jgi:nitrate reductase assembly molybdenum cofactor insertion protein NarJ